MYIYTRTFDTPLEKKSFKISILTKKNCCSGKSLYLCIVAKNFSRVIFFENFFATTLKKEETTTKPSITF